MKHSVTDLNATNIVDFIGSIFEKRGDEEYLGEPVTMPRTVVALLLPTVVLAARVTTPAVILGPLEDVIFTLAEITELAPLNVVLPDTVKVPAIDVLAGTEPNKLYKLIFLDAGVPVGSSIT